MPVYRWWHIGAAYAADRKTEGMTYATAGSFFITYQAGEDGLACGIGTGSA
ncbi:hypothetical protein H8L47_26900 [Undibacterium sp. NL8W]|uniref:Uncharacterized protein n=2 Tax=Undibacterium umbellatum TaxID=2762300 RepID=A0ABR6ZIY6_9BURK|nr:hypothetical protein [Undibacterium umbellatum]